MPCILIPVILRPSDLKPISMFALSSKICPKCFSMTLVSNKATTLDCQSIITGQEPCTVSLLYCLDRLAIYVVNSVKEPTDSSTSGDNKPIREQYIDIQQSRQSLFTYPCHFSLYIVCFNILVIKDPKMAPVETCL